MTGSVTTVTTVTTPRYRTRYRPSLAARTVPSTVPVLRPSYRPSSPCPRTAPPYRARYRAPSLPPLYCAPLPHPSLLRPLPPPLLRRYRRYRALLTVPLWPITHPVGLLHTTKPAYTRAKPFQVGFNSKVPSSRKSRGLLLYLTTLRPTRRKANHP